MIAALLLAASVSIEASASKERCFVQEPFEITVRVRYDEAFFREKIVQLFARELDIPFEITAPWLDAPSQGASTLALNGNPVSVDAREGVIEFRQTVRPTEPGRLELAAPVLRYAFATRFEEDFISGRVPLDRKDVRVRAEPIVVEVRDWPAEGRPASFTGAVGRFRVSARTDVKKVVRAEPFRVTLQIQGAGNLAEAGAPRLDGLEGFHLYGTIDEMRAGVRTIHYDVALLDPERTEFPSIAFAYLDPEEGRYRTLQTRALPLPVEAPPPPPRNWTPILLVMTGVLVGALLLLRRVKPAETDLLTQAAERFARQEDAGAALIE
ncbi:MAG: hypothetical protein AAGD14_12900, partial [Planctomycetota bacterium]